MDKKNSQIVLIYLKKYISPEIIFSSILLIETKFWIVINLFRLIWYRTEFRSVSNIGPPSKKKFNFLFFSTKKNVLLKIVGQILQIVRLRQSTCQKKSANSGYLQIDKKIQTICKLTDETGISQITQNFQTIYKLPVLTN